MAVGGGLTSGAVGPYMNSQKQDLQKTLQDEIRSGYASVDKLPHNVVRIRMHARAAFDTNSSSIKPGFCTTMDKVADVVVRYGKTTLTVVGPADNKGTVEHNRKLSRQRALSVAQYLESKDVNPVRLAMLGKGAGGSDARAVGNDAWPTWPIAASRSWSNRCWRGNGWRRLLRESPRLERRPASNRLVRQRNPPARHD